ncbi:MAG: oxidoreductase [Hirschia sp.]|mgnify:CR=1 FL=1|nr:oxidoreductase [Hirschia sp.]MBF17117.1 oxidoreductase [Hirschia sp.]
MARCTFLGLGVMGAPMAGWLQRKGHDVTVWNRTISRAQTWCDDHGGKTAVTPDAAITEAQFIFMCLGDDPDVRKVFDAFEPGLREGVIVVDHTTASPELARELYERCAAKGAAFIDAPVSGGQAGAQNGQVTIMAGGDQPAFDKAAPIMDAYAKQMTLIGEAGAGQLAKCVNQICIAGIVEGLAEGLHFAKRAGLDEAKVIEAISKGAAQSWQMENRWETMTRGHYEHGFAIDWMRKDLRIALEHARKSGARLPVAALVDQFYADVQGMGGNRWDTSSLLARYETPGAAANDA